MPGLGTAVPGTAVSQMTRISELLSSSLPLPYSLSSPHFARTQPHVLDAAPEIIPLVFLAQPSFRDATTSPTQLLSLSPATHPSTWHFCATSPLTAYVVSWTFLATTFAGPLPFTALLFFTPDR